MASSVFTLHSGSRNLPGGVNVSRPHRAPLDHNPGSRRAAFRSGHEPVADSPGVADSKTGRGPEHDAPRGPVPGLLHPRDGDDLDRVAGHAVSEQPRAVRSAEEDRERRHDHRRAGREVVVAGPLPESRLLPPQGRQVARRPALHVQGREVHVRHAPRGARRARQAADQSAKGLVRQRRGGRDAGHLHGGLSPEEASALVAPDARLRLHSGLRRSRAPRTTGRTAWAPGRSRSRSGGRASTSST